MRNIEDKLVTFINSKLKDNGSAQKAIADKDARSLLVYAAEACVGQKEVGGNNMGEFVALCQNTIGKPERENWCMSFVQSMIAYVEQKLDVNSLIYPDENCLAVWTNTPDSQIVKSYPARGAIAIWRNIGGNGSNSKKEINTGGTGKRSFKYKGYGHTAFVIDFDNDSTKTIMKTVEGNTNALGSSDGQGVYKKVRSKVRDGDLEIVGYLIPFPKI